MEENIEIKTMREIDYERLVKAIERMQTLPIKGNDYAEVSEKVKAFRYVYPRGQIKTYQSYLNGEIGNRIVGYHCEISDDDGKFLADGDAEEKEGSSFINKTSFIENCQTSAIGRALSFVGLIRGKSIASYEEVMNAKENQENKIMATKEQLTIIKEGYDLENIEKIKEYYKVKNIEELTLEQASKCCNQLKKREKNNG